MFKFSLATAVAAAAIAALPAQAATNLVLNGDFETTAIAGSFEFGASYSGRANAVANWTSSNASAYNLLFNSANANTVQASTRYSSTGNEKMWASTASPTGGNFVALDGDSSVSGAISQMISGLTIGQTYTLQFSWGAGQLQSRSGDTTEKLHVTFGNQSYDTAVLSDVSHGFTGWKTVSTNFTATGTSQLLSFLSLGTPTGLPPVALLDGISLTAAVPEASTWMMMILGFGAIGCAVRRSRTTVAYA